MANNTNITMAAEDTHYPGWAQENRSHWVTISVLVLAPMTIVLFAMRTWARRVMTGFATEDWVLLVGFVCLHISATSPAYG